MYLSRANLYPYQQRAIEFGKECFSKGEGCGLFLEPGLGKGVSGGTLYLDLAASFDVRRVLIVGPLRVARKVWPSELATWSHLSGLHVAAITGTVEQRMRALQTPADVHTLNRENVQWLEAQFIDNGKLRYRFPWDMVILDESSSFKSQSSERWKSMARLRKFTNFVVELTGTPSPNGYTDLWSQLYLLDGGARLGRTESGFRDRWFTPPHQQYGRWQLKAHAAKEIQTAISDIVLAMRTEDYLDLPPVVNNFVRVTLPPRALATYKRLEREYIAELFSGRTVTAVNSAALDAKLLQLSNGAVYVNEQRDWEEFHDEKVRALGELLEEIGGKAIIAYAFKHDLARITALLEKQPRPWAALRSDAEFDRWAAGEYDFAVLHPASAGHGLNDVYKSGAEHLIHFGMNANLELYQQVNNRLTGGHRRKGRNVVIHHIVADDTRDDDYVELLKGKGLSQDGLMVGLSRRADR